MHLQLNLKEAEHRMSEIKTEVQKQDEEIKQLQKHLKEAEHILVKRH